MNAILAEQLRVLLHENLHLAQGMDPNAHTLNMVDNLVQATLGDVEESSECLEERKINQHLLLAKVVLVKVGKAPASLALRINSDILHLSSRIAFLK